VRQANLSDDERVIEFAIYLKARQPMFDRGPIFYHQHCALPCRFADLTKTVFVEKRRAAFRILDAS
jgi:hypothetical protein